jgi:hypothetical protein
MCVDQNPIVERVSQELCDLGHWKVLVSILSFSNHPFIYAFVCDIPKHS